jgi:RNA polymerase sigma-70 factor (ECF subfamily)
LIRPGCGFGASAAREELFGACFRDHYAGVLDYALRRLRDRAGAEDVAAETFLVAWRRLEDMPDDPLPWLLGIARRLIQNELRSLPRGDRLAAHVAQPPDAGGPEMEPSPGPADVLRALARLAQHDRAVLMLTTWGGLDLARFALRALPVEL